MRTAALSASQRRRLLMMRSAERPLYLKEIGWCGLQDGGILFPHWNEANAPREIMHDLFSKGTGMTEMCGLLHVAIVQQRWFTERQLNQAIASYPWPEDVRIPMITTKELKATAVGQLIVRPALSPSHCHCHSYPLARHVHTYMRRRVSTRARTTSWT